jgi:hypothetical protein
MSYFYKRGIFPQELLLIFGDRDYLDLFDPAEWVL